PPALGGLKYVIISERGTRTAAIQARRLDVSGPGETTKNIADQLKAAVPSMVITRVGSLTSPNLLVNHTRPPFNDVRVRRAVDLAIDRDGYIKGVLQGAAVPGAALVPKPFGSWGLSEADLVQILGKPEGRKAAARKLLAEAGDGPGNPPRFENQTTGIASHAVGWDAPDAILFENYGCASSRNYTGYCDEAVGKLMDQQSQELDPKKR